MKNSPRKIDNRSRKGFRRALLLQAALAMLASQACADFYSYVGKDGVMVYTNIPTSDDAVRVLREQEERTTRKEPKEAKAAQRQPAQQGARERKQALRTESESAAQLPIWPVIGVVTSRVGWRHDPIDGSTRHHNGVDIGIPSGTGVRTIAAGTVVESGWHGGYGNLVVIDHGNGTYSMYGHNSQLEVRAGEEVKAAQIIALSGSTGRSTGPHLHFELWKNGSNVTESYLRNAYSYSIPEVASTTRTIKSYQKSDGSLAFTNKY